jgi:hypothetical protein
MKRATHNRGGFAAIMAIVLLGLVGATLAMMATSFVGEATRTRTQAAAAQARQLLIAGEMIAQGNGDEIAAGKSVPIQLPAALVNDGAALRVTGRPENVQITAQYQTAASLQLVTLTRGSNGWKITTATLDPEP